MESKVGENRNAEDVETFETKQYDQKVDEHLAFQIYLEGRINLNIPWTTPKARRSVERRLACVVMQNVYKILKELQGQENKDN